MKKVEIEVEDESGKTRKLDEEEVQVLTNAIEKNASLLLKKFTTGGNLGGLFLLAAAKTKKVLGIKPIFTPGEKESLIKNFLGFKVHLIRYFFIEGSQKIEICTTPDVSAAKLLSDIVAENQYRVTEEMVRGKTVVDAGANIGIFSIYAARLGAKKVYAFEPVPKNFEHLKRNIAANRLEEVIIPVQKACGDRNQTLEMNVQGFAEDVSASFVTTENLPKRIQVEVVSLDSFMGGKEIAFIKMDVEGYEEQVLLGAEATIKKYKPVLSFSVYHRAGDETRLPELVKSFRKDYIFERNESGEPDILCR